MRERLLATTIIAGAVILATPAFAQAAPASSATPAGPDAGASIAPAGTNTPDQGTSSSGGEIVVTGSRIPQPNLTSASPVTVLNSQAAKLQGTTRIEDLINTLPQAMAAQSSGVSNGADGTATVNLRNLGTQRTLVLVNGRRLGAGDPVSRTPAADLNFIPTSLIKRVDVLTGGASSVYGSDAVAGVVNFIMDTDYTGIGADTQYGVYQHDNNERGLQDIQRAAGIPFPTGNTVDGRTLDATVKIGAGFDDNRGHVVAYVGYRKIQGVNQSTRDYSSCSLRSIAASDGGGFDCGGGSSTADPATFIIRNPATDGGQTQFGVTRDGGITNGVNLYNANPVNLYQRPDERYTAGFFGHYNISDGFKPYVEFMFMDDHTDAVIAPSGDFQNTTTINCDNPFLSGPNGNTAALAQICNPNNLVRDDDGNLVTTFNPVTGGQSTSGYVNIGRRNVEGGGRDADLRHTDYRAVVGAKGDVARGISYDASFQYSADVFSLIYKNEFSISRLTNGLDAITGADGNPICRVTAANPATACTPIDFFSGAPLSTADLNYLQVPGFQSGGTHEITAGGSITFLGSEYGIQSPWSDQGLGLNVGVEYRRDALDLSVDNEFATGDLAGQGGPTNPISGAINVKEIYGEVQVPLASDKPFFHQLTLDGGFRYSDYSTSGGVSSYKGQLTWAPVRDITFRGGYNRAVRAANIQELFFAQSVQLDGATDPCAGNPNDPDPTKRPTFSAQQCVNLGVPTNRYGLIAQNPSQQYNGLLGGNPNLKPEKADTFTAGIILQPSFLRGFSATVDAYSIKVKNIIGTIGADTILNQCGVTGDPLYCGLVHRDGAGSLWLTPQGYVVDTNLNAGTLKTRGIDVNVSYNYKTDNLGTFGFNMTGTYTDQFTRNVAGAKFDCAGLYGASCGLPMAKWRHQARVSWTAEDGFGLSLNWRYFGKARGEDHSIDTDFSSVQNPADSHLKAVSYFDLVATGHVADHFDLRLGVNNIMDKHAQVISSKAAPIPFGNGNIFSSIYDPLGRYLFVGVSVNY